MMKTAKSATVALVTTIIVASLLSACGKAATTNAAFCRDAKASNTLQDKLTTGPPEGLADDFDSAVAILKTLSEEAPPQVKAHAVAVYTALNNAKPQIHSANLNTPGGRYGILASVLGAQSAQLIQHGNKITAYVQKNCK
jgi:hypothetical protein